MIRKHVATSRDRLPLALVVRLRLLVSYAPLFLRPSPSY